MGPVGRGIEMGAPPSVDLAFEVQYLLEAPDAAIGPLRSALAELGDALVIVGGGGIFNVHVHTDQPDRALADGRKAGRLKERHSQSSTASTKGRPAPPSKACSPNDRPGPRSQELSLSCDR